MSKINILNFTSLKDFKNDFFKEHHNLFISQKDLSLTVIENYIKDVNKAMENLDCIYIDNPLFTSENYNEKEHNYEKITLHSFVNLLNSCNVSEEYFKNNLRDNIYGVHSFFYLDNTSYILRQTVKEFIVYERNLFKISNKVYIKKKVFGEILKMLNIILIEVFEDDYNIKKYIENFKESLTREYSQETLSVFRGNKELIDLIYYFSEEFVMTDNRASDLTKYNQIYFYINDLLDGNPINKESYKKFIRENFYPFYNPTKINNLNQDHQNTLYNLAKNRYN